MEERPDVVGAVEEGRAQSCQNLDKSEELLCRWEVRVFVSFSLLSRLLCHFSLPGLFILNFLFSIIQSNWDLVRVFSTFSGAVRFLFLKGKIVVTMKYDQSPKTIR